MKINIVGGGPAGLYAAYRLRRSFPDAHVRVIEQNPLDVTFGFGVVFSDRALEFLGADDPDTLRTITDGLETWTDIELRLQGEHIRIDGVRFTAIGRLALIRILLAQARSVGVEPEFDTIANDMSELLDCDLLIGADGANSVVRRAFEAEFGTRINLLNLQFAWFGATRPFDCLTQTFVDTPRGPLNAHHYRFSPTMSTFLVECEATTFANFGFAEMDEEQSRRVCQEIFADTLEGAELVTNRSIWRRFPEISNANWSVGHAVLVGDALRTAHYSIGSGTRLALEDVQSLVRALEASGGDVPGALAAYESERRPIVDKLVTASASSARWYETFGTRMRANPWQFALDYIGRSGRINPARLAAMSPDFVGKLRANGILPEGETTP